MKLESRFYECVERAHAAYKESLEWARKGDIDCAYDELRVCNIYRARALMILDNSKRMDKLINVSR